MTSEEFYREAHRIIARDKPDWSGDATTCRHVQDFVCSHYGISRIDLLSHRRPVWLTEKRMIAMYLCRHATRSSMVKIGMVFRRDHSTVMHGIERIKERCAFDPEFSKLMGQMIEELLG